ncbi:uncharacterized protein NESG_00913 [Nematocida ausubeli]|uniref:Tetratricopeptide repeat protein n=1 Tax=Nematocida ausubeli (strain ATCC PRA-371 / ERTm2) TaxID=1913371 RepID=A0A086J3P0_NEMA1|nr:uncharacterized protein NESG_00913 [Nematocida ausubeli]KFG26758.1 hypothetical protein NESG_00913 [Nematocida ausubeli]
MKTQRKLILKYIKTNEIDKALETALYTIKYYEPDYKVQFYTGYCYFLKKDYPQAVCHYKQAIATSSSPEESLEASKGLAKIYIESDYMYIKDEDRKEIENVLETVLEGADPKKYTALEKDSIIFLLSIYLYNDLDQYMAVFRKYCMETDSSGEKTVINEAFSDEGFSHIRAYFCERLKQFHRDLKSTIESGYFSMERKVLVQEVKNILAKVSDLPEYYKDLIETYRKEFLADICSNYLLYLIMRAYSDFLQVGNLLEFMQKILEENIPIEDTSLVLMTLSDFMNIPALLGSPSIYKKVYYNTLSPTILLLRFPGNEAVMKTVLEIYKEIEIALGREYKEKVDYVTALLVRQISSQEVLTDRECPFLSSVTVAYPDVPRISSPMNLLIILDDALKAMNLKVINEVLDMHLPSTVIDDIVSAVLDLMEIPESAIEFLADRNIPQKDLCIQEEHKETVLPVESNICTREALIKITRLAYNTLGHKDLLLEYVHEKINSEYHLVLVKQHMALLKGKIESVHACLIENEIKIDSYRVYLVRISKYTSAFEMIYSYYKFACEYINKTLASSQSNVPVGSDYLHYASIYSKENMQMKTALDLLPLNLYKYSVDAHISHFKHLLAINHYEKGNSPVVLQLLKELYDARPNDYYLISDFGVVLAESNESLHPVDKYLRVVQNISSPHLFMLSMEWHKRQESWEMMERRAKEVLMFRYEYTVKMALTEALTEQKKYRYAIKILSEIEETENKAGSDLLPTVKIFNAYLHIKIDSLDVAEDILDSLLAEEVGDPERTRAVQYKKHIRALQMQAALKTEEAESVIKIAEEYKNLPVISEVNEEPTEIERSTAMSDAYVGLVQSVLMKEVGAPVELQKYLETDDQQELVALSKLILAAASTSGQLQNPAVHSAVLSCIKKANLQGETRDALEVELILRIVRDEDTQNYYEENRKSEETAFARVVQALLYSPVDLAPVSREYLKNATIAEMDVLLLLAQKIAEQKNPRDISDLEAIYLHLCRKYTPDREEVRWLHELLKK